MNKLIQAILNMNIYKWYSVLSMTLAVIFAACNDDMPGAFENDNEKDEAGVGQTISLMLSVTPGFEGEDAVSRSVASGTVDENKILDFWFIEYSHKGRRIGFPHYYTVDNPNDRQDLEVIVPNLNNIMFKGLIIANTHNPQLFADQTSLDASNYMADLRERFYTTILSQGDCITSKGCLPMSGSFDIYSSATNKSTEISCQLRRDVVKMTVQLAVPSAEVKLETARWCNVPGKVYLLEHLNHPDYYSTLKDANLYKQTYADYSTFYKKAFGSTTATAPEINVSNWGPENVSDVGADAKNLVFYLPRNVVGIHGSATDEKDKNIVVSEKGLAATYFEIKASTGNYQLRYRIYPGKDKLTDFNLLPNYSYVMPIIVRAPGNPNEDSRVSNMNKLKLEESNSYIINPSPTGSTYDIPISRINNFWRNQQGDNSAEIIRDNDEWIAEVIWQDQPRRLIYFYNEENEIQRNAESFIGQGDASFFLRPVDDARGNVIIGVRKKTAGTTPSPEQREYLWSWHLWLTDYEPDDQTTPWVNDKYAYDVRGGSVHRYESSFWQKYYLNKYIMDRNLGALASDPASDNSRIADTYGMYYQFGRFAPMPHSSAKVYDINGNEITSFRSKAIANIGTTNMAASKTDASLLAAVKKPYMFFASAVSPAQAWLNPNEFERNSWDNPTWHTSGTKSIFDPCPPGWCIPGDAVWENFRTFVVTDGSGADTVFQPVCDDTKSFETNKGYFFYLNPDDKAKGTTWYPAAGYKDGSNAQITNEGTTGTYWMRMPASENFGQRMDFTGRGVQLSANYTRGARSDGSSVRCIRQ